MLQDNREFVRTKLHRNERDGDKLKLTKIADLLHRRTGETIPYRTLHCFCVTELDYTKTNTTVRVDDCDPGQELQVDFGRMGLLFDPVAARRRVLKALIFTAVYSRHMFVWLTHSETLPAVIDGFEAAWTFFEGVFRVVIPDNLKAIVDKADAIDPRINDAFYEYAQDRGFVIDPARVGQPTDKPRVERTVSYTRESFFKGEDFKDLADAQRRAPKWCLEVAGQRIHGTTKARPLEVFRAEELPVLLKAPEPAPPTPPITPRTSASTRPGTSPGSSMWRALPGRQSGPMPSVCSTTHCRGQRCARSTGCSDSSAATAPSASRTHAPGLWSSTSLTSLA